MVSSKRFIGQKGKLNIIHILLSAEFSINLLLFISKHRKLLHKKIFNETRILNFRRYFSCPKV